MTKISRREYLESLITSAIALSGLPSWAQVESKKKSVAFVQGGFAQRPADWRAGIPLDSDRYLNRRSFRFDVIGRKLQEIESKVPIHCLESHPHDLNLTLATPRNSNAASLVDWKSGREVRTLKLRRGRFFYGHGAFAEDGKTALLMAFEVHESYGQRFFVYHVDVDTMKITNEVAFPLGIGHDIVRLEGSKFAIGPSGIGDIETGTRARLGLYDSLAGKFESIETPKLKTFASGIILTPHILRTSRDRVLAITSRSDRGALHEAGLYEYNLNTKQAAAVVPFAQPGFLRELLSFDVTMNQNLVWLSVPEDRKIIIWNRDENRLQKEIRFDAAVRSIRVLEDEEIVVIGTDKEFQAYHPQTLERISSLDKSWPQTKKAGLFCSHTRLVRMTA